MYRQAPFPRSRCLRSVAGAAAFVILLTSAGSAGSKSGPREARLDARHGGQPRYAGERDYPHYSHGSSCLYYRYAPNCPYYELPNWNGGTVIMNPGG